MIAKTPSPPYYAVIFTSIRTEHNNGYSDMSSEMMDLAHKQDGFLGVESEGDDTSITVSYWRDLDSIKKWKENESHLTAQEQGRNLWYKNYKVRIAKVERDYKMGPL